VRQLGTSDLEVSELCLGGNVFGWTSSPEESFAVLDAYLAGGGNFVDTADVYSVWVPGNSGGESEAILGDWMAARGNRDEVVVATKIGQKPDRAGLTHDTMVAAVDDSLARLKTDRIDLLYAHVDDQNNPLEEALSTFDELVRAGKVRQIAASNYAPERLSEALEIQAKNGYATYVALQPHYNLVNRDYEQGLADICEEAGLACLPYYALASGFLTGKYRSTDDAGKSARGAGATKYLDEKGDAILDALDEIAAAHGVSQAAVALGWLAAQPTVVAPIASARTPAQLADLLPVLDLELTAEELDHLDVVSA
jgi:aryl-alcohol dehydrogenase-like predicted oxidoreductase